MIRRAAAALLLLSLGSPVFAFSDGPGSASALFLKIPVSARSAALADAITAEAAGTASLETNPAGLAGLRQNHLELTLLDYIQDTKLQSVAIGVPVVFEKNPLMNDRFFLGFQYKAFNADDESRNSGGGRIGEFTIRDETLLASLAAKIRPGLSAGISGRFISREIGNESANGVAADLGVRLRATDRISLGASLLNLGSAQKFINQDDPLPLTLRVGGAYEFERATVYADIASGRDQDFRPAAGAEWRIHPLVALRSGMLYGETLEFAGGLGVRLAPFRSSRGNKHVREAFAEDLDKPKTVRVGLDYAAQSRDELGFTHAVTLSVFF